MREAELSPDTSSGGGSASASCPHAVGRTRNRALAALLPKLISGELRVKDAEKFIAEVR